MHRAPVVGIVVLDGHGAPLPEPLEVAHDLARSPDMQGSHHLLVVSEEQFKVSPWVAAELSCWVSFKKNTYICYCLEFFLKYLVYFNSCIYQHLPTCYTCTVPFSSLTSTTSILEKIAWFKISDILLLLVCYQWPKLRNFSADILCKKFDSIKINGLQ